MSYVTYEKALEVAERAVELMNDRRLFDKDAAHLAADAASHQTSLNATIDVLDSVLRQHSKPRQMVE